MKYLWFVLSLIILEPSVLSYDPLATGKAPTLLDREIKISSDRTIPVRVYLPSESAPAPVILFSHGLGGSREGSNYLGRHWSSRGYVTVFLQHPGSDESVWKGKPPSEILKLMKQAASGAQYRQRIEDVRKSLDQLEVMNGDPDSGLHGRLDLGAIGMSGHSFGAKTTQAVSGEQFSLSGRSADLRDLRIDAALPMSPSPQQRIDPEISFGKVDIPWLLMTGTEDGSPSRITDTTPQDRLKVFPALPPGDKYELVLDGAEHHAFTERVMRQGNESRNPNHHPVILATSTAFWDAYLKNDAKAKDWLKNHARSVMEPKDRWSLK